jgi:hypothetical protein
VRTCRLEPTALRAGEDWFEKRRVTWERRLDRLADYLADDQATEGGTT